MGNRLANCIVSYLSSIRINFTKFTSHSWYKASYIVSPIQEEIFNLSKQNDKDKSARLAGSHYMRYRLNHEEEDNWTTILYRPLQMCRSIKRYHNVGNWFLVHVTLQGYAVFYVWFKAFFHQFETGNDETLAKYYASHYFPRFFESYPNPRIYYPLLMVISTYYMLERIMNYIRFIRQCEVNKNGYKSIDQIQLNYMSLSLLNWDLKEWHRFLRAARRHGKVCRKSIADIEQPSELQEKAAHLYVDKEMEMVLRSKDRKYLYHSINPIDFSKCYEFHGLDLNRPDPDVFYTANPCCRIDITELSWFIYYFMIGVPFLLGAVVYLSVYVIYYELSLLIPTTEEATLGNCISQLPALLSDPNRYLRVFDCILFFVAQLPIQNHTSSTGIDIATILSRTRKVTDLLKDNLEFCIKAANQNKTNTSNINHTRCARELHEDSRPSEVVQIVISDSLNRTPEYVPMKYKSVNDIYLVDHVKYRKPRYYNVSQVEKDLLCRKLERNLRLAQVIKSEFDVLKNTHSAYINLIIAGSGLCFAVAITAAFAVHSNYERALLFCMTMAGFVPLMVLIPLCVQVERAVSTSRPQTSACSPISHH